MQNFSHADLNVVYEDNHIIVVLKPQNVPCCPDGTGDTDLLSVVKSYLKEKYAKAGEAFAGLVHRLDRPTGGVMVFAKTTKAASRISADIQENTKSAENADADFPEKKIEKKYFAVTVGVPKQRVAELTHYLLKDEAKNKVRCVPMATDGAQRASLDYQVLEEKDNLSLLLIRLHTGRAHQIRVQLSQIGTPVFGDQKYGEGKTPVGFNLALWASELRVVHPVTKEKMTFRVYPPVDEVPWKYFDVRRHLAVSIKNN